MLKYIILLLFPVLSFAQNNESPCQDSVDIWMEALSKDSLIYRPEGDSLILLIAKSENKDGILFLFDHLHKRDDKYAPMFGDMQSGSKQRFYIEHILRNDCNIWTLLACVFDYLEIHEDIDKDKAFRFIVLFSAFENDFLESILKYEYFHSSDKTKRKNISLLENFLKK